MYLLTLIVLTMLIPLISVFGGIKKGMLPYAVILQSALFMGFSLVLMFGYAWSTGEPLGAVMLKEMGLAVNNIVASPELLKVVGLEGIDKTQAASILTDAYANAINMIPSSIICWGLIFSYFDYMIISKIMNKQGKAVLLLPSITEFSLPRIAIYGSLLIYALSWGAVSMNIVTENAMLFNVQAIIIFVFAVQGLSVVIYTLSKKKMNKILRWVIYITIFSSPFGRGFLALFGFFDLIVGIRQKLEIK